MPVVLLRCEVHGLTVPDGDGCRLCAMQEKIDELESDRSENLQALARMIHSNGGSIFVGDEPLPMIWHLHSEPADGGFVVVMTEVPAVEC